MALRLTARRKSCEPRAYSEDIRWRMVWQREIQELPLAKVAENLSVDTSTVHRVVKKFELLVQSRKSLMQQVTSL